MSATTNVNDSKSTLSPTSTSTCRDAPDPARLDERFAKLKQDIVAGVDPEMLTRSYERVKASLATEIHEIERLQQEVIPTVEWSDVVANGGNIPNNIASQARRTGCVLFQRVVPESVALEWKQELERYTRSHPAVGGKPLNNPTMWLLYWTKPQMQARSHPDVLGAARAVLKLWHVDDESLPIDLASQVHYADRFRIRAPGDKQFSLRPHLDSSSIERWEDPVYRAHYEAIFKGDWEQYDPWCMDTRADAETNIYKLQGGCSAFRAMQGWLSMSNCGPGEGTLRVLPSLQLSMAYIMLRPFFLHERFDAGEPTFPGATPGRGQLIPTEQFYPHLQLQKSMISVPRVRPGDYMFWHCDTLHAVEYEHNGSEDSSVFYNASTPLCSRNINNMITTRKAFRQVIPPMDFYRDLGGPYELERLHEDHGAREENLLCLDGLRALGLEPFDADEAGISVGQRRAREMANRATAQNGSELDDYLYLAQKEL